MKELLIKDGSSIACFKPGDLITRIKPSITEKEGYNENLGISQVVEVNKNHSYIGDPLKFIGIFNNQIWLEIMSEREKSIYGDKPIRLNLHDWSEDWDLFELPKGYSVEDL